MELLELFFRSVACLGGGFKGFFYICTLIPGGNDAI